MTLTNKTIILGITAGIAAYKSAELARRLKEAGAQVRAVLTSAAQSFITPLTMQAVTGHPVHYDLFDPDAEAGMGHIQLARLADLILIAPATADFIAKLTYGHANDLLTTLCLASKAKIAIAPAMNQQMWRATITQSNIKILEHRGILILGPDLGEQACGDIGFGRMLEPQDIILSISQLFSSRELAHINIMITAGPTQELIDPVRFISNFSSGKMGYALAEAAVEAGAQVTLISGPVALKPPAHVQCIQVRTAQEMHDAVMSEIKNVNIFIGTAAVADYRCAKISEQKIKKNQEALSLKLIRNPDILAAVAQLQNKPFVVGFAAETENLIASAKQKLQQKSLDLIVGNQVGHAQSGFISDKNSCVVISQQMQKNFPLMLKHQLARELISLIANLYHEKNTTKNS